MYKYTNMQVIIIICHDIMSAMFIIINIITIIIIIIDKYFHCASFSRWSWHKILTVLTLFWHDCFFLFDTFYFVSNIISKHCVHNLCVYIWFDYQKLIIKKFVLSTRMNCIECKLNIYIYIYLWTIGQNQMSSQ